MHGNKRKKTIRNRKIVGLSIIIIIALIHALRVGKYLEGSKQSFYYSYASDLLIPFGFYFLLCIAQFKHSILKKWFIKALLVFGAATLAEVLQFFKVYALGKTFDPVDILMYCIGVGLAVIIDNVVFKSFIPFWEVKA